jgi:hypothetical protein
MYIKEQPFNSLVSFSTWIETCHNLVNNVELEIRAEVKKKLRSISSELLLTKADSKILATTSAVKLLDEFLIYLNDKDKTIDLNFFLEVSEEIKQSVCFDVYYNDNLLKIDNELCIKEEILLLAREKNIPKLKFLLKKENIAITELCNYVEEWSQKNLAKEVNVLINYQNGIATVIPDNRELRSSYRTPQYLTKEEALLVAAISGFAKGKHYFQLSSLLPTIKHFANLNVQTVVELNINVDSSKESPHNRLIKLHNAIFEDGLRGIYYGHNNLSTRYQIEIFKFLTSITAGGKSIIEGIKLRSCYSGRDFGFEYDSKRGEILDSIFNEAKEIHIGKLIWLLQVGPQLVRNGRIPSDIFWKISSYFFSCSEEASMQFFAKENNIFLNKYNNYNYLKRWIMSFSLQNIAFILQNMNHVSGGLLKLSAVTTCHLIRMLDFGIEALSEKQVNAPLQGMVCKLYQYGTFFWNKPGQMQKAFQNRFESNSNLLPVNNPDLGFKK